MKPAIIFVCLLASLLLHRSTAQSCASETFSSNKVYTSCSSLPYLGASIHWTYHASNNTVDIAYRAPESSAGWVAWAINPTGTGMAGANAFLAFHNATSGAVTVYTTQFATTGVKLSDVKDGSLSFPVHGKQAEYANGYYTIYAALGLPDGRTRQNTVWQATGMLLNGVPYGHNLGADNVLSMATVDFLSGGAD